MTKGILYTTLYTNKYIVFEILHMGDWYFTYHNLKESYGLIIPDFQTSQLIMITNIFANV